MTQERRTPWRVGLENSSFLHVRAGAFDGRARLVDIGSKGARLAFPDATGLQIGDVATIAVTDDHQWPAEIRWITTARGTAFVGLVFPEDSKAFLLPDHDPFHPSGDAALATMVAAVAETMGTGGGDAIPELLREQGFQTELCLDQLATTEVFGGRLAGDDSRQYLLEFNRVRRDGLSGLTVVNALLDVLTPTATAIAAVGADRVGQNWKLKRDASVWNVTDAESAALRDWVWGYRQSRAE